MHTSLIHRMHIHVYVHGHCGFALLHTKTKTGRRPSKRPLTSGRPKGGSVNMVLGHAREVAPVKISEAKHSYSEHQHNSSVQSLHMSASVSCHATLLAPHVLIVCACAFNSLDRLYVQTARPSIPWLQHLSRLRHLSH